MWVLYFRFNVYLIISYHEIQQHLQIRSHNCVISMEVFTHKHQHNWQAGWQSQSRASRTDDPAVHHGPIAFSSAYWSVTGAVLVVFGKLRQVISSSILQCLKRYIELKRRHLWYNWSTIPRSFSVRKVVLGVSLRDHIINAWRAIWEDYVQQWTDEMYYLLLSGFGFEPAVSLLTSNKMIADRSLFVETIFSGRVCSTAFTIYPPCLPIIVLRDSSSAVLPP